MTRVSQQASAATTLTNYVASVDVEGRIFGARPLRGSGLGTVCGPAVVVDSLDALRIATTWLPGRVLVLADDALAPECLAHLEHTGPEVFAAIIVLCPDPRLLAGATVPAGDVPAVAVARPLDCDTVRRAIRLCVSVDDHVELHHPIPAPRRPARRPSRPSARSGMPGTVEYRVSH